MQIGSKMFPEYPIRGHAEAYSQLRKTLGIHSPFISFDIRGAEYRRHKMILAMDCERILDLPFTGLNTRAGDQTVIKLKYASSVISGNDNTRVADQMHIVLHSDQILEIHDVGVRVSD